MFGVPPILFGSFICGNGLLPLWFWTAAASFIHELMTDANWVKGDSTHQTAFHMMSAIETISTTSIQIKNDIIIDG